jgi:alpha-L-rhamnosidase
MSTRLISLALAVLSTAVCQVVTRENWAQSRWKAQWIACPDAPQRDAGIFHFRKAVSLVDQPKHFIVHVSADNHFILYVNGTRAGIGPAASDLAHWRYETFDLAPALRPGDNIIGATVWNFGTSTPVAQMTSQAGFILQGDGDVEQVANTGSSWQVEAENGHSILPVNFMALLENYYAGPPGELIDARIYDWGWSTDGAFRGSDSKKWKNARIIGAGAARGSTDSPTIWSLVPDPLPQMEMTRISAGRVVSSSGVTVANSSEPSFTVAPNSTAVVLLDAGALTTAYPELSVNRGSGARVRVSYAEALVDDRKQKRNRSEVAGRHMLGVYDEFVADGGHRTFTPLIWRTWRFLQIDVTTGGQPLTVEATAWFTAYPFREQGSFASSDPELAKIWEVGWRTARLCAHDTYMDTPYWERLQYVGDTRLQALVSYTVAGDDKLARQAIDAIDDSRIPDGITQSRYPSQLPQMIPTFSLMWVGMVHDFWMHRDDPEYVRRHLPGTRTVLDWFIQHQSGDGLLDRVPWWPFVDWTDDFESGVPPQDADGGSAPMTLQFIEALRNAADLERHFGDRVRAQMYTVRADQAAAAIRKLCWNEKLGLIADTPSQSHFSQHANALAVWLDVIPTEQQTSVMTKVLAASGTNGSSGTAMSKASYYFQFYVARALEHAGMADLYLGTLAPWRKMLQLGLTTWAETPEPTRSDSHAWSSHPNYDLLRLVAGIRTAAPGFSQIVIEPHLGTLQRVEASMPHPKGRINVLFTVSANGTDATIHCPDGVPAKLIWHGTTHPLHAGAQTLRLP